MNSVESQKYPNGMHHYYPKEKLDKLSIPKFNPTNIAYIQKEVSELKNYFNSQVTKSYEWRIHQLSQMKKMLMENEINLVKAMNLDFKRFHEAQFEIHNVLEELHFAMDNLHSWMMPKKLKPNWMFFTDQLMEVYEPLGVVLNISPWNFPLSLSLTPVIGAIAAGNCVAIKPSEISSNTSAILKELIDQYMDPRAIKVFNGDVDVATEVLKQRWDHIMYTGNTRVGKIVMRAASENLTPVTLELGGKCPTLVDLNSTNLRTVCDRIINSKAVNWGQVCIAPDYIVCLRGDQEALAKGLKETVERFFGSDYQSTDLWGPLVNDAHTQRIVNLLPDGSQPGDGDIVVGGRYDMDARFIEMTIVKDVNPHDSKLMREEIFGPVLPIVTFDNWDEAFNYIQSREKPLGAYLYSNNNNLIKMFREKVSSGSQCVNDAGVQALNSDMAFGGVGASGMGVYHGRHSFKTFSHAKGFMKRSFDGEKINQMIYPPKDWSNMFPVIFPYMFRVIEGHGTMDTLINTPITFLRWMKFILTTTLMMFLNYGKK